MVFRCWKTAIHPHITGYHKTVKSFLLQKKKWKSRRKIIYLRTDLNRNREYFQTL